MNTEFQNLPNVVSPKEVQTYSNFFPLRVSFGTSSCL